MGAAVPIVASIITSVVVSKVATKLATSIGLSDDLAQVVGIAAGAYGGYAAYGATSSSVAAAGNAGQSGVGIEPISQVADPNLLAASTAPVSTAPVDPYAIPDLSISGAAPADGGLSMAGEVAGTAVETPGMLTQGLGTTSPGTTPAGGTTPPVGGGGTADAMIQSNTVGIQPTASESWFDKLMQGGKTMDLIAGAMSGYGKAGIEEYKLEYPEKIRKRNAEDWAAADPGGGGFSRINQTYPSQ